MKERFAKLLLGEDMSGHGNGVSSALALSNAITNLAGNIFFLNSKLIHFYSFILWFFFLAISTKTSYIDSNPLTIFAASVFGKQNKLAPMPEDLKKRWRKEVNWLLSVTDNIVEFVPSQQQAKDGSNMEVNYVYFRCFCVCV